MDTCQGTHKICQKGHGDGSGRWYPERLVCLTAEDGRLNLIDTDVTTPGGPYVTLSHCWGKGDVLKTAELTLSDFMNEIPSESLTKTFRDAVAAARRLGVGQVWIDSLCIIQADGSPPTSPAHRRDWEEQSALMHKVYRHNLAATASPDSHGWVQQERILSRRVVHFGKKQVFWECEELMASETYPEGTNQSLPSFINQPLRIGGRVLPPGPTPNGLIQEAGVPLNPVKKSHGAWGPTWMQSLSAFNAKDEMRPSNEKVGLWSSIVEAYTSASLTFEADKLPAFSGIAKYFQPFFGGKYLAGIWGQDMHRFLAWCSEGGGGVRVRPYRAPSWSWASIDGPVGHKADSRSDICSKAPDLQLLDAGVEPSTADPTGAVSSGYLVVEGTLSSVTLDDNQEFVNEVSIRSEVELDEARELLAVAGQSIQGFMLPIMWVRGRPKLANIIPTYYCVFLFLQLSESHPGCYTRIGLGTSVLEGKWDGSEAPKGVAKRLGRRRIKIV
ncbi:hypothetical protein OQA88_5331 [Cercophora sp. LCS_1]